MIVLLILEFAKNHRQTLNKKKAGIRYNNCYADTYKFGL